MGCFSVNKIGCDKWEILQICCKEWFKRTGKFKVADNLTADSIPSAGSSLRMCLPVRPLNAVYIYIYTQLMQWGRIRWRDGFLPGALSTWAACCRLFCCGLVAVAMRAAREAGGHRSLCCSPTYTGSSLCYASLLPLLSIDLSPWGPAKMVLRGYRAIFPGENLQYTSVVEPFFCCTRGSYGLSQLLLLS